MTPGRVIDVVAAVIERDGCYLACRRAPGRAASGKWEFPGGKVEPGETAHAALVREIREELDAAVTVTGELTVAEASVSGATIRLICLHARLDGPVPTASTDHDELRWVAASDLASVDWAEPDWPAVHLLMAREGR